MPKRTSEFRFRSTDTIGSASAEDDAEFLKDCFVETGDFEALTNRTDIRQIILGRTGSGKSALFARLKQEDPERTISIEPHHLALTYVSNSNEIRFFSDLGVNMDPFYKLLWRHVLTVEILRKHFESSKFQGQSRIWEILADSFNMSSRRDVGARKCIDYLRRWGDKFCLETEYRVQQITQKLENNLRTRSGIDVKNPLLTLSLAGEAGGRISEERKIEVINRAQRVVADAQIHDLNTVVDVLEGVLTDRQKYYYVVIDRLDENWVEDRLRYRLIMALIDAAKEIGRVTNIKVVISIRRDLIERVFRLVRETGAGFQEEKYQSLYLPLRWSQKKIIEIVDKRIGKLVERHYEKRKVVTHADLLPKQIDRIPIAKYITDRAPRPRDVIMFLNKWIEGSEGKPRLSISTLRRAEGEYSRQRLSALYDEWYADYPELSAFGDVLKERPVSFMLDAVDDSQISDLCLETVVADHSDYGDLGEKARSVVERAGDDDIWSFKRALFMVFYKVGLVGLKLEKFESVSWVDELGQGVSYSEVDTYTRANVHPTYGRALGIRTR